MPDEFCNWNVGATFHFARKVGNFNTLDNLLSSGSKHCMEIQLSAEIYHSQPEIQSQEMVSWRHRSCKMQASIELLQMSLQTAEAYSTHLWISSIVPWSIVSSQIYLVRRRCGFLTNLESKREREVPVSLHLRTKTDSHVCNRQQDTNSHSCHPPASAAHSPPDTHSDPSFHIPCTLYSCIPNTNFKHKMIF
jgi:hypothetical protein